MNKHKILLIEDDTEISEMLTSYLTTENYEVICAVDGQEACNQFDTSTFSLVLLDLMIPKISGMDVMQYIRKNSVVPVIIVSAKDTEADKTLGLGLGADDYITKPFNPLEVVARVKTQLRRYQKYNNPVQNQPFQKSEYDIRGLIINKDTHKCSLFGKEVSLTPIEFSILWYLCEHQGKVISSEELFENVWKEKYLDNNNTVMAHIGRLRGKLNEPAKKPKFIKTVWGIGYEIE